MEQVLPVSALTTAQLVTSLTKLGITRSGLDSVREKEVTGSMLCEFCEEDIKDVFSEFKDRFQIRKLLRDIADKSSRCTKPETSNSLPLTDSQVQEWSRSATCSPTNPICVRDERSPPSPLCLSLPSSRLYNSSSFSRKKQLPKNSHQQLTGFEEIGGDIKTERGESVVTKKQRVDDVSSALKIPAAHSSSYSVLQSTSHYDLSQHPVLDSFTSPPSSSPFFGRTEFLPSFIKAHPQLLSGFPYGPEQRQQVLSGSGNEDQALCLKKSPPHTESPLQTRTDAASPATQPSSTTPDYHHSLDTTHLDFTSIMSMGHLAAKYSAQEILSKKGQRSRPSSAQKLGSILIRNAAQQADLWSSPPHLRNISQPQKQEFLNSVYRVAPHIRDCEHLLWQRLSETLQNRRKYLLDKKLGKRGLSTPSQSSTASQQDLTDISQWQITSVHNHLNTLEELQSGVNNLNEAASAQEYGGIGLVKKEPITL